MRTLSTIEVENIATWGAGDRKLFAQLELHDRRREQDEMRGNDPESRNAVLEKEIELLESDVESTKDDLSKIRRSLGDIRDWIEMGQYVLAIDSIEDLI